MLCARVKTEPQNFWLDFIHSTNFIQCLFYPRYCFLHQTGMVCFCYLVTKSCLTDSLRPHGLFPTRLLCPWDFPGKHPGGGCHFLFLGILPNQGWNSCLLYWHGSVQVSLVAQLCPTLYDPGIAAHQASLSIINSRSLLQLMTIESVMPSSHLIFCHPLLLLLPIPTSIRVFSNESTLCMRCPKY